MKIFKRFFIILLMIPTTMIDTMCIMAAFVFKGEDRDFELTRWLDKKIENETKK